MLVKVKELIGYKLNGLDGEVGSVNEYYVDDSSWMVRYLVANTGGWLTGRTILISPNAIIAVNKIAHCIDIDLTKKQIEDSPSLDSDKPVSRQFEKSFFGYYGWPQYWSVPSMWGYYPGFERISNELETTGEEEHIGDSHLRSTKEVSGYHLQASDGEIGHVKDFIIDDETWAVRYLIIDTTNWFAGKKLLISPKWIDHISCQDSTVFINHTRESIRLSPEYTEDALLTQAYETQLHHYYNHTIYGAEKPLTKDLLRNMNAYWRAANYIAVGQLYLRENPLLREPLKLSDCKKMLLGHWGTTPGQNFIYVHLNRVIKKYDLDMFYIAGPGHGGPALVGNTYLEGTYTEVYPNITQDESGLKKLFTQFSFPGGIPSHVSPDCPGSIHEGGELGYSLSHAFGAAFDNPELIVACIIGDGEAETGPLATAWHSNKFLNPISDGAVLPILHLNGYKIANPTIFARMPREELDLLLRGYGWTPYFVEGDEPETMHQLMAGVLDVVIEEIKHIQTKARTTTDATRPHWPMIVFNSPKGWTGPKEVDGLQIEGTFRSHQIPLLVDSEHPHHVTLLEDWMKSYKPEELFDTNGRLMPELADLAPTGKRRMGASPHANGGLLLQDLIMPDFRNYAVQMTSPGSVMSSDTHVLGEFLRDVITCNKDQKNFRIFGPDEILSNRLNAVFEVTNRQWEAQTQDNDEFLATQGRAMEMLSEHQCEGWLEGYLLTGRHGLFTSYEAFIHIVDSMFNQHAKWLKISSKLPWRKKIASLNYLLASHVWQQAHNGDTHQDPGFIDHVVNKKASIARVYLPPDSNCLLSVWDHCLRSRNYVNVVIAGKYLAPQWLTMEEAIEHCTRGISIWQWASNDQGLQPDVVMACCGDVPTFETMAAVSILREELPELKIRVVNVVDLMKLEPSTEHPHGLTDAEFDALFTKDKPIVFAFHGYPKLIHLLTYRRTNHENMHVRGYKEEGTITTFFDNLVLNDLDRFHLVIDVINRLPQLSEKAAKVKRQLEEKLIEHRAYITKNGEDLPEIRNWKWKPA